MDAKLQPVFRTPTKRGRYTHKDTIEAPVLRSRNHTPAMSPSPSLRSSKLSTPDRQQSPGKVIAKRRASRKDSISAM